MQTHTIFRALLSTFIAATLLTACEQPAPDTTQNDLDDYLKNYKVTRKVDGVFEDVSEDIKGAVIERGIKINNISHIGHMLARTGSDVGATVTVFADDAIAIEFCSSTISRETMEADPHNIVFCPYIISVYSLPGDLEHTYVSYRRPLPVGDARSKASIKAVEALIEGIIVDAVE
ncbi:MAG: DUF302 domain-containing protein [Sulfuriflexus sp.]|nr:DUF302 domain-containing protein [Sulfuriflexus sp.]